MIEKEGNPSLENDIDFILSHFDESNLFPRKMMTKHKNYQFTIYDKKGLIQKCIESDLIDCRVNGYPIPDKRDLGRYPPNFVFIDLDLSNFCKYKNPQKMLDKTLRNTLNKISVSFSLERSQHTQQSFIEKESEIQQQHVQIATEVKPTVLWSGNGYHIYLPIKALELDNYEPFSKNKFPNLFSKYNGKFEGHSVSEIFLLFAIKFLTDEQADPLHRPRYNSCLIRIPETLNSKCLDKGLSQEESRVKLIQKWNGYRPPIQLLTKDFRRWLFQEEINQWIQNRKNRNAYSIRFSNSSTFQIQWIERLLHTGISDGRKETLRLILGPYLGRRKNYEESIVILEKWLNKCDCLRPLDRDFNSKQRIKSSLRNTKGFLILDNLKIKYPSLHSIITKSIRL